MSQIIDTLTTIKLNVTSKGNLDLKKINLAYQEINFSLNSKDELFSFTPFIEKIKEVALSYDLNLENSQKDKN